MSKKNWKNDLDDDLEDFDDEMDESNSGGEQTAEETIEDRFANYGVLQYDFPMICKLEGLQEYQLMQLFEKEPNLEKIYWKSKSQAQYLLDLRMWNLAMSGDAASLKSYQDKMIMDRLNKSIV